MPISDDQPEILNALAAINRETSAQNDILVGLSAELKNVRTEAAVNLEGTRASLDISRRNRTVVIAVTTLGLIYTTDQHVELCGPGAQAKTITDLLATGKFTQGQITHLAQHRTSTVCDALFPLHAHQDANGYPTTGTLLGGALLGVLAALTACYLDFAKRRDLARVKAAGKPREL